jgi:hypothetical protein
MYCSECGKEKETDAQFCIQCGNKFTESLMKKPDASSTASVYPSWYIPPVIKAPSQQNITPTPGTQPPVQVDQKKEDGGFFSLEKKGINMGVLGGILMITIAVVWFFGALAVGLIFWYPPVLALFGVYAVIKGLVTGNIQGNVGKK